MTRPIAPNSPTPSSPLLETKEPSLKEVSTLRLVARLAEQLLLLGNMTGAKSSKQQQELERKYDLSTKKWCDLKKSSSRWDFCLACLGAGVLWCGIPRGSAELTNFLGSNVSQTIGRWLNLSSDMGMKEADAASQIALQKMSESSSQSQAKSNLEDLGRSLFSAAQTGANPLK